MEDLIKSIKSLLESIAEYGRLSVDLFKLKVVDKIADFVSSAIPFSVVLILFLTFLLFVNIGVALWFGEIFGKMYLGFFAVAAFYLLLIIIIRLFLRKWFKRVIGDYVVKRILK